MGEITKNLFYPDFFRFGETKIQIILIYVNEILTIQYLTFFNRSYTYDLFTQKYHEKLY